MKLFLSGFLILLFTFDGICQKNNSFLIGKWKISSLSSENDFYYDVKKDSLWFSAEFKMSFKNNPKLLERIGEDIRYYGNCIESYDEKQNYTENHQKWELHAKYKIDEDNKIIKILDTDGITILFKKWEYNLKNNQLYYTTHGVGLFGNTKKTLDKI